MRLDGQRSSRPETGCDGRIGGGARRARRLAAPLLLAFAALVAMVAPAVAQTVIWEAQLGAESVIFASGTVEGKGFVAGTGGTLSDRTFSYKGDSFNISILAVSNTAKNIYFQVTSGSTVLANLTSGPTTFHFGNSSFLSTVSFAGQNRLVQWLSTSLTVTAGTTYTVKWTTTEPGAPRNLAVATDGTLSWTAPSSVGGSAITGYEYRQREGSAAWGSWTAIDNSANLTSYQVTGLDDAKEYTFQLRAKNNAGSGLYSDTTVRSAANPIVSEITLSDAGSSGFHGTGDTVTVSVVFDQAVTLSGGLSLTLEQGDGTRTLSGPTGSGTDTLAFTYDVQSSDVDIDGLSVPENALTLASGATLQSSGNQDADLTHDAKTFPDHAVNPPVPAITNIEIDETRSPVNPDGFHTSAPGFDEVSVAVTFSTDVTVGGGSQWRLSVRVGDETKDAVYHHASSEPSVLRFVYDVASGDRDTDGVSVPAGSLTPLAGATLKDAYDRDAVVTHGAYGPFSGHKVNPTPSAPANLRAERAGTGTIRLFWNAAAGHGFAISKYVFRRRSNGGSWSSPADIPGGAGARSHLVSNVSAQNTYDFEVWAENAAGAGMRAELASVDPGELRDPSSPSVLRAPQALTAETDDSRRVALRWALPADAAEPHPGRPGNWMQIEGYRIEVCAANCANESNWGVLVENTRARRYAEEGLEGDIRGRKYRVRAIEANGEHGSWSEVAGLPVTEVSNLRLAAGDEDDLMEVWFNVRHPNGETAHVLVHRRGDPQADREVRTVQLRRNALGDDKIRLYYEGLAAETWYEATFDWTDAFDSARRLTAEERTLNAGMRTSGAPPKGLPLLEVSTDGGGTWDGFDRVELQMGGSAGYRLRVGEACEGQRWVEARFDEDGSDYQPPAATLDPARLTLACAADGPGPGQDIEVTARPLSGYPRSQWETLRSREVLHPRYTHMVRDGGADGTILSTLVAPVNVAVRVTPMLSVDDGWERESGRGSDGKLVFAVRLDPAGAGEVEVDYATRGGSATEGEDYVAASGTLVFEPGEPLQTVEVTVIDDAHDDAGETFALVLSNPRGAELLDGEGTGTIHNTDPDEGPVLTGLTLVDAADQTVLAQLADGATVELDDPDGGSYGIRADAAADAEIGSVRLELSGAKTVSRTENGAPYSLYGDAGGALEGGSLPVGSYTLRATAYAKRDLGGDVLQTFEASFAVAAEEEPEPEVALSATFPASPYASRSHSGPSDRPQVVVAFSEATASFAADTGSVSVSGASVASVQAHQEAGLEYAKLFFLEPTGDGPIEFTLVADVPCADGGICTADGRVLAGVPEAPRTIEGVTAATEPVAENSAATDAPTISGTAQVDETLTASVSGISDAEGLENASYAYQWIRGSTDIGGATDSTYTLVNADEGETIKVRVSFTDDAGNAESFTSAATDAVAAAPEPLTASFSGVPAEHAGEGRFTFDLAFSEHVQGLSFRTLRDEAFDVSGGAVRRAKRKQSGSNLGWTIHVEPASYGPVTIRLPAGSVETADGRALSNSPSATVAGPVGISVADASVDEAADAVLEFVVTLSRAASAAFTVAYQTSDGSATAGQDYTATSGTLSFQTGDTSKTIEVAVLDDSHDEGEETLTLRLSNPSGGRLADGEATGTIENRDPLPRAFMARFGRAVAVQVVEQVEERIQAPRRTGFEGRVAGRELRRGMEREVAVGLLHRLGGLGGANRYGAGLGTPMAGSPAGGGAMLGRPGPWGVGLGMAAAGPMMGDGAGPARMGGAHGPESGLHGGGLFGMGLGSMGFGGDSLLTGSAFALNRETGSGGILSFWSRGAQSSFHGREGDLSLDGRVRTTMFGFDYARGPLVAGLSLANSRGRGGYSGADAGEVTSSVTGLYPWLGYKVSDRITLWGVTGYGKGALRLTPGEATTLKSGLSMAMAAGGMRGELADSVVGGFGLAFKADALWVGTGIEGVEGPAGRLAATAARATRFRTGLEASRGYRFKRRVSLEPSLEVGLRRDGGDAETGAGVDLGGGLIVSDTLSGLSAAVRVRMLLVHEAEGFRDRGVSVSFSYNPTPSTPLGFMAKLTPSWGGQTTSGAEALWGRETMVGMAHGGASAGNRLQAELGYGLPVGSRLVGTPRFGIGTSEYGRDYRLGYSLGALGGEGTAVELGVDAQRRERSLQGSTDHGAIARATVHW